MYQEPEIDCYSPDGLVPKQSSGHVEFRSVRFSYPNRPDVEVLKASSEPRNSRESVCPGHQPLLPARRDVRVRRRERLRQEHVHQPAAALLRPDGGGGTLFSGDPLVDNMGRLIPTQILLDGRPLPEYNVRFLRETIGVVSQEPVLFDTTIEVRSAERRNSNSNKRELLQTKNETSQENIRFGREDVTRDEMLTALRRANAYDFVNALPEVSTLRRSTKKEALVELGSPNARRRSRNTAVRRPEAAHRHSQGARAQPQGNTSLTSSCSVLAGTINADLCQILLLDEATSALDAQSESIVQQALENVRSALLACTQYRPN